MKFTYLNKRLLAILTAIVIVTTGCGKKEEEKEVIPKETKTIEIMLPTSTPTVAPTMTPTPTPTPTASPTPEPTKSPTEKFVINAKAEFVDFAIEPLDILLKLVNEGSEDLTKDQIIDAKIALDEWGQYILAGGTVKISDIFDKTTPDGKYIEYRVNKFLLAVKGTDDKKYPLEHAAVNICENNTIAKTGISYEAEVVGNTIDLLTICFISDRFANDAGSIMLIPADFVSDFDPLDYTAIDLLMVEASLQDQTAKGYGTLIDECAKTIK